MRSLGLGLVMLLSGCAAAQETAAVDGKALFERHCAECHAPGFGHPGTQRLEWSKGAAFAVLEAREDLTAAYVAAVVRSGLLEMPPFRPTEISDAELALLGAYLARGPEAR